MILARWWKAFFEEPEFFRQMLRLGAPIGFQSLIMSILNMVSVMMVGQLGEQAVAAVGLANQIFFLLNLLLFGITSGTAILTAQLWGQGDSSAIRQVQGVSLGLSFLGGAVFFGIAVFVPEAALGVYSEDPAVIRLGSDFLLIAGWSCLFVAVTASYANTLRSIGIIRLPVVVNTGALALNAVLSYALIFGIGGLPVLGVRGAAIGVLISRIIECSVLVAAVYLRELPVATKWQDLLSIQPQFAIQVLNPVLPVTLTELLWAFGITAYNVVYARIGTEAVAAINIVSTIDQMAFVTFIGMANACAILVGNLIGAGDEARAFRYAARTLGLGFITALATGGLVWLVSRPVLSVYKVSPQVIESALLVLNIVAATIWMRVLNLLVLIGALRSGGDTRFALFVDGGVIWVVGVPMAALGGLVLRLPLHLVYLMLLSDEVTKLTLAMIRFRSGKWIHNLAKSVTSEGRAVAAARARSETEPLSGE